MNLITKTSHYFVLINRQEYDAVFFSVLTQSVAISDIAYMEKNAAT